LSRKKAIERALATRAADEKNRQQGTDYVAVAVSEEPAIEDVMLTSRSRAHRDRKVQVVTIPIAPMTAREDTGTRANAEARLRHALEARDLDHRYVTVHLNEQGLRRGLTPEQVERLAAVVTERSEGGSVQLDGPALYQVSPDLAARVAAVSVYELPELEGFRLAMPMAGWAPTDGRWIQAGIDLKLSTYGNAQAVSDVILVIGALGFIDRAQIASFQRTHPPEMLPFSEIWLVSQFEGVFRLK
jgi:hypothetical protein